MCLRLCHTWGAAAVGACVTWGAAAVGERVGGCDGTTCIYKHLHTHTHVCSGASGGASEDGDARYNPRTAHRPKCPPACADRDRGLYVHTHKHT